jgi:hypothetical protein
MRKHYGLALVLAALAAAALALQYSACKHSYASTPSTKSGDQTPGAQTPGDQTPGDQTPGDQTPGDQTPGDQTPGDETPGDQTPGEETPPVDKTALAAAITAANNAKTGITSSVDGAEVNSSAYWVTAAVLQTFNEAIAEAQEVNNSESATQTQVDTAKDTLEEATLTFNNAKNPGTAPPPAGRYWHWNFQTLPAGWTDGAKATDPTIISADATTPNTDNTKNMTLLSSTLITPGNRIMNTTGAVPASSVNFSAGYYQPGTQGDFARVEGVAGPFIITVNYQTSNAPNARYPSIKIGSTTVAGEASSGADDPKTLTYTYTGTDTVTVILTGATNPGNIYDVIIKDDEPVSQGITITLTDEGTALLSEASFSIAKPNGTRTVTAAGGWDNPKWYVDDVLVSAAASIEVSAADYSAGAHTLTLIAAKNGIPYSKALPFTVTAAD